MNRVVAGVLVLILPVIFGCEKAAETDPSQQRVVQRVHVVTPERRSVESLWESFGTVINVSKADVYSTAEGTVTDILVEEGDLVDQGQVMATLQSKPLQIALQQANAEVQSREALLRLAREKRTEGRRSVEIRMIAVEKARTELAQRQADLDALSSVYADKQKLHQIGGVSDGELESIRNQLGSARSALALASKDLEIQSVGLRDLDMIEAGVPVPESDQRRREALISINTRVLDAEILVAEAGLSAAIAERSRIELLIDETQIRAPIAGFVASRSIDRGERADPQRAMFTLFNDGAVHVQVDVGEGALPRIRVGQFARVRIGSDGQSREGLVALISPYVDPQTHTGRVRIALPNRDGRLRPGMFVHATVVLGPPADRLTLPEEALLREDGDRSKVFLVRSGLLFGRQVIVGPATEGRNAVLEGLSDNDVVVLNPSRTFRDGTPVEVVE